MTKLVRIARTAGITTFNPLLYGDKGTGEVLERMYSHLAVTNSAGRYAFGGIVAAADPIRVPGRAGYRLRLRDDARWHDGPPVTAADVAFTIGRVLDPAYGSPRRPELLGMGQDLVVRAEGPHTVRVEFTPTGGAGIWALAWLPLLPVHRAASYADQTAPLAGGQVPVGSGEFRFGGWDPAAGTVTLRSSSLHWRPATVDEVRVQQFASPDAAVDSVLRGDSDVATKVRPSLVAALAADLDGSAGVQVHTSSEGSCVYLGFNTTAGPLQDRAVRTALAAAIDRHHLVSQVLAGYGITARTLIHPRSDWHCPDAPEHQYDARAAAAALDRAGWRRTGAGTRADAGGQPLSLTLKTVQDDDVKVDTAGLIARQLAAVGVEVRIETSSIGDLLANHVYPRRYEMVLLTLNPLPSPLFLGSFYHSSGGDGAGNRFGYANPAVDELIDALAPMDQPDDPGPAREAVADIQRLVARDVPHVPLFHPDVLDLASTRLLLPQLDGVVTSRFADLHRWNVGVPDPAR